MDRKIRLLVSSALATASPQKIDEAYKLLLSYQETLLKGGTAATDVLGDTLSDDIYIVCAEAAIELSKYEEAKACLRWFFLLDPPANQFLCRGYFCQALVEAQAVTSSRDSESQLKAISYIMKALAIARRNPRYNFLVYNASVLYWRLSRPFFKEGYRRHLLWTLPTIVKALEDVDDKDYEWRARFNIHLARCYEECGKTDDALTVINTAAALVRQHVPKLRHEVYRLQVRYNRMHPKDLVNLEREAKESPELAAICKLEKIRGGTTTDKDTVERELTEAFKGLVAYLGIDANGEIERGRAGTLSKTNEALGYSLIVETGRYALDRGIFALAQSAVEIARNAPQPAQRIQSEYLACELMVRMLGPKGEVCTRKVLDVRLEALARIERALLSAERLGDARNMQSGCALIWNIALPLLQPNLRFHVKKMFATAAQVLETLDSPLTQLRCQLHIELAKCEEAEELMVKAQEQVSKAISLDFTGTYARWLESARQRLEIKTQIYAEITRTEDQVLVMLEQASEAKDDDLRRAMLERAGSLLAPDVFDIGMAPITGTSWSAASERIRSYRQTEREKGAKKGPHNANDKERAQLWADIAKSARHRQLGDVARKASEFFLEYQWDIESDRDLVRLQAQVHFIRAESIIQIMRRENLLPCEPPVLERKVAEGFGKPTEEEWADYTAWALSLSHQEVESFMAALDLGAQLREDWIVLNAAVYLWNYHAHIFRANQHWKLQEPLIRTFDALRGLGDADVPLLAQISNALALALIQRADRLAAGIETGGYGTAAPVDKNAPAVNAAPVAAGDKKDRRGGKTKGAVPTESDQGKGQEQGDIRRALDVCDYALSLSSPLEKKFLVPTWVHLKLALGQPFSIDEEKSPETRVMVALELLALKDQQQQPEKVSSRDKDSAVPNVDVLQAMNTMADCRFTPSLEIEMWTRLANEALLVGQFDAAVRCGKKAIAVDALEDRSRRSKEDKRAEKAKKAGTARAQTQAKERREDCNYELLHVACRLMGQGTVAKIDPLKQDKSHQDKLRREALAHFAKSARYGEKAGHYSLVLNAAHHFWNACIPFIGSPITRRMLVIPLQSLLTQLATMAPDHGAIEAASREQQALVGVGSKGPKGAGGDAAGDLATTSVAGGEDAGTGAGNRRTGVAMSDVRVRMYEVLFECLMDQGRWTEGLRTVNQAFSMLSREVHKTLWKYRIVFKSRLGHSTSSDMNKLQDETEEIQAKVWHTIAESAPNKQDALSAFQRGIALLKDPSLRLVKAEYLVEFGEWLYRADFPIADAIAQLEAAVDLLMDPDNPPPQFHAPIAQPSPADRESKEAISQSTTTLARRPSASPGSARKGSKGAKGGGLSRRGSKPHLPGGGTVPPSPAVGVPPTPGPEGSTFEIPVIEDSTILLGVRRLEMLARSYVMLAKICGHSTDQRIDYCLLAHFYFMKVWEATAHAYNAVAARMEVEPANSTGSAKDRERERGERETKAERKNSKAVIKRPSRTGATNEFAVALPSSLEEWAEFDYRDELRKTCTGPEATPLMVCSSTVVKPDLFVFYMNVLVRLLKGHGYHLHCLPLLQLLRLVADVVMGNSALVRLVHLELMDVCVELNLGEAAQFHESRANITGLTDAERALSREEVRQRCQQLKLVAEARGDTTDAAHTTAAPANADGSPGTKKAKPEFVLPKDSSNAHVDTGSTKVLEPVTMREIWVSQAELCVRHGYYAAARELLCEVQQHAKAFSDNVVRGRALMCQAHLKRIASDRDGAAELVQLAQSLGGDFDFWQQSTLELVDDIAHDPQRLGEARDILDHALAVFEEVATRHPNAANDSQRAQAVFRARLASIRLQQAQQLRVTDVTFVREIEGGLALYEESVDQLELLGGGAVYVDTLLEYAAVTRRVFPPNVENGPFKRDVAAMRLLRRADNECERMLAEVRSHQAGLAVSLPVQRQAVRVKVAMGNLLLDMHIARVKAERDKARGKQQQQQAAAGTRKLEDCVAEYLDETAELDADLRDWHEIAHTADQDAVVSLSGALNLAGNVASMRALAALQLGRCLRQLSVQCSESLNCWAAGAPPEPEPSARHTEPASSSAAASPDIAKGTHGPSDGTPDIVLPADHGGVQRTITSVSLTASLMDIVAHSPSGTVPPTPGTGLHQHNNNPFLPPPLDGTPDSAPLDEAAVKADEPLSIQYLRQAFSHLIDSVSAALESGSMETARAAALEVMECYGSMDPVVTGAHLCLYQSCLSYASLIETFRVASREGGAARERALLNQIATMVREHCDPHANCSAFRAALEQLSARNRAYGRIAVVPPFAESIVENLPNDFRVVVLQHSPDRRHLYGCVLWKKEEEKPTTLREKDKSAAPPSAMDQLQALSARIDVDPAAMDAVVRSFARFRFDVEKGMIRRHKEAQLRKVHVPVAVAAAAAVTKSKKEGGGKKKQKEQQEEKAPEPEADPSQHAAEELQPPDEFDEEMSAAFNAVVAEMEGVFGALIARLSPALASPNRPGTGQKLDVPAAPAATASPGAPGATLAAHPPIVADANAVQVVLILDGVLCTLPVEAFSVFNGPHVRAISRDVSLHMLLCRLKSAKTIIPTEAAPEPEAAKKSGKEGRRMSKQIEEKPPVKAAKSDLKAKKAGAAQDAEGDGGTSIAVVDPMNVRYVVDARDECKGMAGPDDNAGTAFATEIRAFHSTTGKWAGIYGSDHMPSTGEMQRLLSQASGFFYFGLGRCLSYLPPRHVAGIDMSGAGLVVLLDHVQTEDSHRRQSKLDVKKTPRELQLEQPHETATLLSLRGVASVVVSQWDGNIAENRAVLGAIMGGMLGEGRTIGSALQMRRYKLLGTAAYHGRQWNAHRTVVYGLPHAKFA